MRLIDHSLKFMTQALHAVDAKDIWTQDDDTCHLNGTASMAATRPVALLMPIVAVGISRISGSAMARFFQRWEA